MSPLISISGTQKAVCRVMAQVDTTQLPDKLIDVEVLTQVPLVDGVLNKLLQQATPAAFHDENLIPNRAIHIIELEQPGSHRAPTREAGSLCPTEPVVDQRL
jgi:hypothetical protein